MFAIPERVPTSRRLPSCALFVGLLLFVTVVAGCSGTQAADSSQPASTTARFPLSLDQQGGAIRLEGRPERVYVIDNWGLDLLVGLGVRPVGAATYFPPSAWLTGTPELAGVELTTISDALPLEKIAAAQPDLIVDLSGSSAADPAVRSKLDAVAPVLYPPRDNDTDTWQDRLRHLGQALDRSAAADALIQTGEKTVADVKQRYPSLVGASLTFARLDPPATFAIVAGNEDFTRRYLDTELGFTTPKAQTEAYSGSTFDKQGGVIEGVTLERLDLLDAGADAVLIWFQDDAFLATLGKNPVWQKVPFVAEDRLVPMNIDAAIAFRTPSPAALAWAADNLMPQIASAVDRASS